LEAWGYPRVGIDWFRRRKLLTIAILAALSWFALMLVFLGLSYLANEFADIVRGFFLAPVGENR
jgi:hypothetical protein